MKLRLRALEPSDLEMMYDIENLLQVGKVNPKEGRKLLSNLLDEYFDSLLIAKYSSMPAWRKATNNEKEEFIILFEKYLVNLAAKRFNEFKNYIQAQKEKLSIQSKIKPRLRKNEKRSQIGERARNGEFKSQKVPPYK